jgi:uncharacterized protein (DUF362 family)/NAD-dependent dihydropyrimidine dehydrogenase PreA subunit
MPFDAAAARCPDYEPAHVRAALEEAVNAAGGLGWVAPGMRIAVKCNLVGAYKPEAAATVHPAVAGELCSMLTARGAEVVIGDSPSGVFTAGHLSAVYSVTGMKAVEETGAQLNYDFSQRDVYFPEGRRLKSFPLTAWLLDADAVIDLCKLKTHAMVGFTCGVKNFFGSIPGTHKTEFHYLNPKLEEFCDMLIDINEFIKPRLTVVDAVTGMEGNGPTAGTPRHIGVIAAAKTPYAADLLAAKLIGLDGSAPTIAAAAERGLCPGSFDGLSVYGDVAAMAVADFKKQPPRGEMRLNSKIPAIRHIASLCFGTGPRVNAEKCVGCGKCQSVCPMHTVHVKDGKARISREACIRCFCCQEFCPQGAITLYRPPLARLMGKL